MSKYIEKFRADEHKRQVMLDQIKSDSMLKASLGSDARADALRAKRTQRQHAHERALEEKQQQLVETRRKLAQDAKEESEAREAFEKALQESTRAEKLKHAITSTSPEIRELERRLALGYMNQARAAQIEQRALLLAREEARQTAWIQQTQDKLAALDAREDERNARAVEEAQEYQAALEAQLHELEEKKQQEYAAFLREKAMVDEIVARIRDEDIREQETRLQKQQETRAYVENYMREREEWKRSEKERIAAENKKIQEHADMQARRFADEANKKNASNEERNIIYDKLAGEMEKQKNETLELETLRLDLHMQEQEEAAQRRETELLAKRIQARLDLIASYHASMEAKRAKIVREREEESAYRDRLTEQFAAEERIEQMNAHKRRMRQAAHKREIERMIVERRERIQIDLEEEQELARREKELAEYRDQVIEQERQRLLVEHAKPLAGYLPKGVFRDTKDLELFDQEFRQRFEQGLL